MGAACWGCVQGSGPKEALSCAQGHSGHTLTPVAVWTRVTHRGAGQSLLTRRPHASVGWRSGDVGRWAPRGPAQSAT